MRILMGIQRLWRGGGTESHVITLASELSKLGHHVTIYTTGGPWVQKARNAGIRVQVEPSGSTMRRQSGASPSLRRLLQQQAFDVLHAHDAVSLKAFTQAVATVNPRPKVVFTVHGHYVQNSAILRARARAQSVIAVSSNIRRSLLKQIPARKLYTVNNGIRSDLFHRMPKEPFRKMHHIPSDAFVIGYSARFTFDKVQLGKRVVRTLIAYTKLHPRVHLVVAGRGSKMAVGSSSRVHVLGHVEQMPQFFNACDAVVATGRTATEALFCNVPVLALGTAGFHGIVTPQNFAQMVQANFGDHGRKRTWMPAALHQALNRIQAQPLIFQRQAHSLRSTAARQLSAAQAARQTVRIYRRN